MRDYSSPAAFLASSTIDGAGLGNPHRQLAQISKPTVKTREIVVVKAGWLVSGTAVKVGERYKLPASDCVLAIALQRATYT